MKDDPLDEYREVDPNAPGAVAGNATRLAMCQAYTRGKRMGVDTRGLAKAIHMHCRECVGAKDAWDVESCNSQLCKLHPYRMESEYASVRGKPSKAGQTAPTPIGKEAPRGIVAGRIGKRGKNDSGEK